MSDRVLGKKHSSLWVPNYFCVWAKPNKDLINKFSKSIAIFFFFLTAKYCYFL